MRSPIPKTKPPHDGMDREPVSSTASFMSLWRKAARQFRRSYCPSPDLRHQRGRRAGGHSGDLSDRPFVGSSGVGESSPSTFGKPGHFTRHRSFQLTMARFGQSAANRHSPSGIVASRRLIRANCCYFFLLLSHVSDNRLHFLSRLNPICKKSQ